MQTIKKNTFDHKTIKKEREEEEGKTNKEKNPPKRKERKKRNKQEVQQTYNDVVVENFVHLTFSYLFMVREKETFTKYYEIREKLERM